MTAAPELDPTAIEQKAELAFGYLTGAIVSGMVYLGDRMGLYRTLAGLGPVTSAEFAEKTGLHERWLREWLQNQAAANILEYRGEGRFELSPEAALVFSDEDNPWSAIGGFGEMPQDMASLEKLPKAFETGIGYPYDEGGDSVARGTERFLGPWNRTLLVSHALPKIEGLVERLEAGGEVADVGCGAGVALVAMAKRFPNSQFHGYDISKFALARAQANIAAAGVTNATLHDAATDPLPAEPRFDLVTCLDVLHDMARPDLAAAAIRTAIKPGGTWFIVDVDSAETFEGNLGNPLAAVMYGMSIMLCMSSSASTPDGLALGTAGLPEPRMAELVHAAGFSRFERVTGLEHPINAYYQARV